MLSRTINRGFSLIEMLIAITVFSLLLVISVSSYRTWVQNSQVRTAALSVLNGLQLAREEASSKNTLVSFTLSGNDWSVDVLGDANYGVPASNIQRRAGTEGSKNAVITSGQNSLTFNEVGRIAPIPAAPVTFSVTNPSSGNCQAVRCLNVVVLPGGSVRMCDPALSLSTNPQGC